VARVVEHHDRAALVGERLVERGLERGDVEAALGVEHREGAQRAAVLVGEGAVGRPVERGRQERLPLVEQRHDGVPQRARAAWRRHRGRARGEPGEARERVALDRLEEGGRAGDGRVARRVGGRHLAQRARRRLEQRELALVVEQHPDRRVDDRVARRAALGGEAGEAEDGIGLGSAEAGRNDVRAHAARLLAKCGAPQRRKRSARGCRPFERPRRARARRPFERPPPPALVARTNAPARARRSNAPARARRSNGTAAPARASPPVGSKRAARRPIDRAENAPAPR
jgi:hypothetical protein